MNMIAPAGERERFLDSVRKKELVLRGMPTEMTVELTSHCQLKCEFCPRVFAVTQGDIFGHMDYDYFTTIGASFFPHLDYLNLSGGLGESLLHPRFVDAIVFARNCNSKMIISISTNCCGEKTVERLDEVGGRLDFIQISIDGIGAKYDNVVGVNGAFQMFERNVKKLLSSYPKEIRFNTVVTPHNFGDLQEMVSILHDWGAKKIYFNTRNIMATDIGEEYYRFYCTDEYARAMDHLSERCTALSLENDRFKMTMKNIGISGCQNMWNNFYISWDGHLLPCCTKPIAKLYSLGKVDESNLQEAINSEHMRYFRRCAINRECPAFCAKCHMLYKE